MARHDVPLGTVSGWISLELLRLRSCFDEHYRKQVVACVNAGVFILTAQIHRSYKAQGDRIRDHSDKAAPMVEEDVIRRGI